MNHYTLQETFVVHQYSLNEWIEEPDNCNYFEIIFVESGSGYHTINDNRFQYKKNDIFLVSPDDTHYFEITKHSKFTFFKFTEFLFSSKVNLPDRQYWLQRIEQLIHHPNTIIGDVICHEEDRNIVWDIHNVVLEEFKNEKIYYQEIISNAAFPKNFS